MIEYNILKRKSDENIQKWKSYPSISRIIQVSRDIIERNDTSNIKELARMMQAHESQHSATVISTIAILVGNKLNDDIDAEYREAIGDIIMWNTPVIKNKEGWPSRRKYSPNKLFENKEDMTETKMLVHGYLGYKASKEIEQFLTEGELRRIAHCSHT